MAEKEPTKASTERDCSTTPLASISSIGAALPTIPENKNESTDTIVHSETKTSSQVSADASLATPAPDEISMPSTVPGNIARWLPNVSNRDPRTFESGVSTPIFPMSPELENENPFHMASSPEYMPLAGPPTRRDSFADSSFSLARVRSEDGSIAASGLSDATGAHFHEIDERLRLFLLDNEPQIEDIPADQISILPLTAQEKIALPFSFECAFGWSGDPQELEQTPKNKEAFLQKISEAKNGCTFIHRTLLEYQTEINSRKNHKFGIDFLKRQNKAIVTTRHQLDQIEEQLEEFVNEVYAISDEHEGQVLKDELNEIYHHVYPWVMRTKRVVHDNHVWYKLNYVMGVHAKPLKPLAAHKNNSQPTVKPAAVGNGAPATNLPARNSIAVSNSTKVVTLPHDENFWQSCLKCFEDPTVMVA